MLSKQIRKQTFYNNNCSGEELIHQKWRGGGGGGNCPPCPPFSYPYDSTQFKSLTKLAKVSLVAVFVKIPYFLNITALNGRVCVRVSDFF